MLLFGVMATCTDPTDTGLRNATGQQRELAPVCKNCNLIVNEKTKHCGLCNRCTLGFDHHCKWLNNCVGVRNYHYFILLLLGMTTKLGSEATGTLVVLTAVWDNGDASEILAKYDLGDKGYSYLSLLIAAWAASTTILVFAVALLCFHVYLRLKGLTTYEFILRFRMSQCKIHPAKYTPEHSPKVTLPPIAFQGRSPSDSHMELTNSVHPRDTSYATVPP